MPSIKHRQSILAKSFTSTSGVYREVFIPWQDAFVAASGVTSMSASLASFNSGSGLFGLRYNSTSSGCFVGVSFRAPQDIAVAGPAAGSGQLLIDWTDITTDGAVAVVSASVLYTLSGSEYAATSTSQNLGSSTCKALTGGSALGNNSASIVDFNAPTNRTGLFTVRFGIMNQAVGNTSGSNFVLYGLRLRYLSDLIGS